MKKTLIGAAAVALGLTGAALAFTAPAQAAGGPVVSTCNTGWYANPDETAPAQVEGGFLFDGPVQVHRATSLDLADVRAGTFVANRVIGAKPLFKLETTNPYTTINVTPEGKFWASAMLPENTGGQNKPVDKVADLVGLDTKPGKPKLTSDTKVTTFGVGYGNDTGNKALVTSITFHGTTYDLSCKPASESPSPSPSQSQSQSPSPSPSQSQSQSQSPSASPSQSTAPTELSPAAPKIGKVTCTQYELVTENRAELKWTVTDTKMIGDTVTIKVTVTPAKGYTVQGQTEWTLSFKVPANCTAAPQPTTSQDAGLPVTGPGGGTNVPLVATLGGVAMVALGGALLVWLRRRRDAVAFTA